MARPPRIFQIGFNKCGTRTLVGFFRQNGLRATHWMQGEIGEAMRANIASGRRAFEGYEDRHFYADYAGASNRPIFEGHMYFRKIFDDYPGSLFILNTRNVEAWIHSRMRHQQGKFADRYRAEYNLATMKDLERLWREQYSNHVSSVMEFFQDKSEQLLVFELDRHGGRELAAFVGDHYRIDPAKYIHLGKTEDSAISMRDRDAVLPRKDIDIF